MANYFPFFTDVESKEVLLLGDGAAARAKIERLRPYGVHFNVVPSAEPADIEESAGVRITQRAGLDISRLITNPDVCAVVVTDTAAFDAESVYSVCVKNRIPVNTVDRPATSTFIFPAILTKGQLTVAVSTSGASPATAVRLRNTIESVVPSQVDAILDRLAELRPVICARGDVPKDATGQIFKALTDLSFEKNVPLSDEDVELTVSRILTAACE